MPSELIKKRGVALIERIAYNKSENKIYTKNPLSFVG
jgi:hypothetical protein